MKSQPWLRRAFVIGLFAVTAVFAQVAVRNQGYVPFSEAPIFYRTTPLSDPVAKLQSKIDKGEITLAFEPKHGYLKSVLDKLGIPETSQTLVFSKTSFQYRKVSPETPRALYFNDDVYIGQVHDGKVIEVVSFDPVQGAIFYILDEKQAEKPVFQRAELDCTQCHVAPGTRNVPGVLVRSVFPTATGTQASHTSSYITSQQSPWSERFGGWYVTGSHGKNTDLANSVFTAPDEGKPERTEIPSHFDAASYLTPHSDIVAQLVQTHQTQTHNLITLTNYQTRIALFKGEGTKQYEAPAEELVRNLLFANEAPLDGPVKGASGYTEQFAERGPRDPKGRSLRDFDLNTRLFRYPCSYLIYSEAFDALPAQAKDYIYRRLQDVLTGREQDSAYSRLTKEDRKNVLEILLATKPDFRDSFAAASLITTNEHTERTSK